MLLEILGCPPVFHMLGAKYIARFLYFEVATRAHNRSMSL